VGSELTGYAYAGSAVAFAWVAAATWRRRVHSPTVAVSLVVVMVGLGVAAIADAVALISTSETTSAIASLAILPGAGLATGAFACLGRAIVRPQWVPCRGLVLLLLVEPVLISAVVATNPWHLAVFNGPGAAQLTGSATWGYGPAFWWHAAYCYVTLLIGLGVIARGWFIAPPAFRRQRLTLLLAAFVPCVANVVYLAGGGSGHVVDPTPIGLAAAGVIVMFALFRQELVTFSPVARALIVDQIGDAILVLGPTGLVLDLNAAAIDLVRVLRPDAPADVVGFQARGLFGAAHVVGASSSLVVVEDGPEGERPARCVELEVRASPCRDRFGRTLGDVYVARDVTEANLQSRHLESVNARLVGQVAVIERLRADLVEVAGRDALTGLHNRRFLVDRISPMLTAAGSTGGALAVVLFDADGFKAINDRYGHLAGDEVLVALAHRVRALSPADALVSRWGGEEFLVALPGADGRAGLAFADEVRRRCADTSTAAGSQDIECTVSGGVAAFPTSGTTINELIHAADVALYAAKTSGRNAVRLHGDVT